MAVTPLTIRLQIKAELLIRVEGSDTLHSLGTITYEADRDVVLQDAVSYLPRNL